MVSFQQQYPDNIPTHLSMKRVIISTFAIASIILVTSVNGAALFTKSTQGQVATWASIWTNETQTTAVAPTAGNTYEAVANLFPFGANATGGGVNNTRVRNPY